MIHLDTSFLIHALVPSSEADRRLRRWLAEGSDLAISSVAWAEFLCGPIGDLQVQAVAGMLAEIVPFTAGDCDATAHLFNLGGRRRGSLPDCMIAAVALRTGAPLATINPKDFRRFAPANLSIVEP
jgi:predicted nucleic acid-binding protein